MLGLRPGHQRERLLRSRRVTTRVSVGHGKGLAESLTRQMKTGIWDGRVSVPVKQGQTKRKGDNFDGTVGYRVEDGKRYVKGLFHYAEDADDEIELWQDEDTEEPRLWHSNDTGTALSGTSFTFKLTADPAKPDFVQETVTYEGTVS